MSTVERHTSDRRRLSAVRGESTARVGNPGREQFIPWRKAELVSTLAGRGDLTVSQANEYRRLCHVLEGLVHCDFQQTLEALKNAYAPFDPDADTSAGTPRSQIELETAQQTLFDQFDYLLARGNFVRVAQDEIDRALAARSDWGLNLAVDFSIFERLEIYCRGDVLGTRYRRRLLKGFRPEAVEVPIFQRLVVIFRLRSDRRISKLLDTEDIHIKLFKEIPKADLEMLLPGTQVRMSLLDRAKIVLPTLSGISIATWKIVQGALIVAAAGVYGSLAFLGLVGGTLGYGVRSFYGYLNTKQKYQLNLTQSLYYLNLDNNAGAIYRLLDEAEEQENREAMLAYFYLWRYAPPSGWTGVELDGQIEAFLKQETQRDVDFEVADALAKLERWQIVETHPGGRWTAISIDLAIARIEARWIALMRA